MGDASERSGEITQEKFDDGEFPASEENADGETENPVATTDGFFFAEEIEKIIDAGEQTDANGGFYRVTVNGKLEDDGEGNFDEHESNWELTPFGIVDEDNPIDDESDEKGEGLDESFDRGRKKASDGREAREVFISDGEKNETEANFGEDFGFTDFFLTMATFASKGEPGENWNVVKPL